MQQLQPQTASKPDKNSREFCEQQISGTRNCLIGVIIFSLLNMVMLALDTGTMFLFSASVPYYLVWFGKCMDNGTYNGSGDMGSLSVTALVIGLVILGVYFLCWILSKKHRGWLIVALVLFCVDTVALLGITFGLMDNPMGNIMDMVFHALVLYILALSVRSVSKLKQMPPPVPVSPEGYQGTTPDIPG